MTRQLVPWVSIVLALVLALNPVGFAFLHDAFFATEQLTRNIAGPIVLSTTGLIVAPLIVEIVVRRWMTR